MIDRAQVQRVVQQRISATVRSLVWLVVFLAIIVTAAAFSSKPPWTAVGIMALALVGAFALFGYQIILYRRDLEEGAVVTERCQLLAIGAAKGSETWKVKTDRGQTAVINYTGTSGKGLLNRQIVLTYLRNSKMVLKAVLDEAAASR